MHLVVLGEWGEETVGELKEEQLRKTSEEAGQENWEEGRQGVKRLGYCSKIASHLTYYCDETSKPKQLGKEGVYSPGASR